MKGLCTVGVVYTPACIVEQGSFLTLDSAVRFSPVQTASSRADNQATPLPLGGFLVDFIKHGSKACSY